MFRSHWKLADDARIQVSVEAGETVEVLLFERALTLAEEKSVPADAAKCAYAGQSIHAECSVDAGSLGVLIRSRQASVPVNLSLQATRR